jgi:hypothetical protein
MFFSHKRTFKKNQGFGLVETVVAVGIFLLVSVSVYGGFVQILKVLSVLKTKNLAANLVNEQIEIIRNLPYQDVGIIGGLPVGKIIRNQTLIKEGITFEVATSIQDIDDPFDGQIGGSPNDLSPADYKLVELTLQCRDCNYPEQIKYYSRVSPQALETEGNNGALFIRVFDSNGNPLTGAEVNVFNDQATSTINIDELTNLNGLFQIVNAPLGINAYKITVTKNGYSTDQTYTIGQVLNPNPDKPDATVVFGQVTQLSFYIDKLSDLAVKTKTATCSNVSGVDFRIFGSKTIGENILKFDENKTTDSGGQRNILGLEWDNYLFDILGGDYDLAGANHLFPLTLNPDSSQNLDLILRPAEPNSLLIQVTDGQTGLPLSEAYVKITSATNNSTTLVTGKGFLGQTDWSGGAGQENFSNTLKYFSQNGNIDDANPIGVLKLAKVGDGYLSSGEIISSVFDIGTTTNFGILTWGNNDQPVGTEAKFQIATNEIVTSTTTWEFFGPDATGSTYYTNPSETINNVHDGDQYLRYKLFLSTTDSSLTPQISNVAFTYNTECAPPGQVLFQNLNSGNYTLEIVRDNYATYSVQNISATDDWQMYNAIMTP